MEASRIAVIAEEDVTAGLLLAGIGVGSVGSRQCNWFTVVADTPVAEIEACWDRFQADTSFAIIVVSAQVARAIPGRIAAVHAAVADAGSAGAGPAAGPGGAGARSGPTPVLVLPDADPAPNPLDAAQAQATADPVIARAVALAGHSAP